ncbi:hypothetical protein Vretimale_17729 [Volvox reticuliferus]|uniref:Transmembrane protein n=1 Tax=Volvox reticuliferus TaxID=1737510 RepID=A0A8J4FY28_9CHLO|nr:hypothetical protein Vretifemale_18969 [Volvox reticuliferus]GIM14847.1 hypothetical protein Vretimale_17729 [Volvox reticuliferus]
MKINVSRTAFAVSRQSVSSSSLRGCYASGLGILAAALFLSYCTQLYARSAPKLADYCPPEPASGQLGFKSIDGVNSECTPGSNDSVGQAIFLCWQQFVININGCQVSMRTTVDETVGPGRMPCRMFSISGNLTGEGVEAQMWAEVDGPGLLSYYYQEPEAVAALRFDSPINLVQEIWAFMRTFTGDPRFDNASWINDTPSQLSGREESTATVALVTGPRKDTQLRPLDGLRNLYQQSTRAHHRLQLQQELSQTVGVANGADDVGGGRAGGVEVAEEEDGRLGRSIKRGPMRMYRTSETRVVMKVPTGCKYRYTVNADSHVFESPSRQHAHVEWRTVIIAAASLSVVLSVIGVGACTYFSRKHAEYVASYWEYQAVKDQLGSELPQSMYVRLFGVQPKTAAAPAAASAAGQAGGGTDGNGAKGGGGRRGGRGGGEGPVATAEAVPLLVPYSSAASVAATNSSVQ